MNRGASPKPLFLRGKWLFGHLLAAVLVVAFVNFGFWQLRRLNQKRAINAVIDARTHLPPEPIRSAVVPGEAVLDYLEVQASGEYAPENEVLLRGRSLGGRPGFNLLTPLVLDASAGPWEGYALLIERGWVPYEYDEVPVTVALPPAGTVTVTGELHAPQRPPEGAAASFAPRDPPTGALVQTFYADVERLSPQMPFPLVPAYVVGRHQSPPSQEALPEPLPPLETDEGPHLGYAIQWFGMALVGIIGYFFLLRSALRQERRERA